MSAMGLRLLACALMLADHIGFFLGWPVLRGLGRLSFPIFAFLIANGARHTHSMRAYALRLGVLALLSQAPYGLCFFGAANAPRGNVFLTLLLGLGCIAAAQKTPAAGLAVLLGGGLLNQLVEFDYGWPGAALILLFWLCPPDNRRGRGLCALGMAACLCWPLLRPGAPTTLDRLRPLSLLALPLLCTYRGRPGPALGPRAHRALQAAFYLFYPAHLLLLWAIFR